MALINDGTRYTISRVNIGTAHLIEVFLSADGETGEWLKIQCTGNGNYLADAYEMLLTLPEWSGAELDPSDIAAEFAGSGGAALVVDAVSLEDSKLAAKARITQARDAEEFAGFLAYGKVFDSDADAQRRILVAAATATAIGADFAINWTCADNSIITLTQAQVITLPVIMAQFGDALHQKARALKASIDAADTIAEIEAVQWSI